MKMLKNMLGIGARGAPSVPSRIGTTISPSGGRGAPPVPTSIARTIVPGADRGVGAINPQSYYAGAGSSMRSIDPSGRDSSFRPGSLNQPRSRGVSAIQGQVPTAAPRNPPQINMPGSPSWQKPGAFNMPKTPSWNKPPPINMPTTPSWKPGMSGASKNSSTMKPNAAYGFAATAAANVAIGAGIGGVSSYATGGNFGQGAVAGGIGGGMMYGGTRAAARLGQRGAQGFGPKMSRYINGAENKNVRRAMIGSGAALSGMMFGGDRSHKRGFNSKRGNSIGR